MNSSDLSQYLFSGLSAGCVFALVALGFVLIANVTRVYNFAQGEYVMVGGMLAIAVHKAGFPDLLCVLVAALGVAAIALIQERTTVAPIRNRVGPLGLVVASLGFGIILRGASLIVWGKDPLSLAEFSPGNFGLFGAHISNQTLWIWAITILGLGAVVALFRFTATGKAMVACASNESAARLIGIRSEHMSMAAFVLGGALTGVVGAVAAPLTGVSWESGVAIGLIGFIAAALAEFRHPVRAVVAGLALGVVQSFAAGQISSEYRLSILYGVLLAYLLIKDLVGEDGLIKRTILRRTSGARLSARARTIEQAVRGIVPEPATSASVPRSSLGWQSLVPVGFIVLIGLAPFVLQSNPAAMNSGTLIMLSAVAATGLGLVMGQAGLFSLGQAAFCMIGGYTAAILTVKHGWSPLTALLAGTFLSLVLGVAIGWLTLRQKGFNLAIATLAVSLILLDVVTQQVNLTGGSLGTIGLPPLELLGVDLSGDKAFFWTVLAVLIVCLVMARNLTRSAIGRSLRSLSVDEEGAEALGVNPFRVRLTVFVIGAGMAGIAGSLWAFYGSLASPATWNINLTISLVTYVVVGGIASIYGGLAGAIVVGAIQYYLRQHLPSGLGDSSEYEVLLNGVLLVAVILIFRQGLATTFSVDRVSAFVRRLRSRSAGEPGPPGSNGRSTPVDPPDMAGDDRSGVPVAAPPAAGGA